MLPAIIMPAVQNEWTNAMPQIFARCQLQIDESCLRLKFDFIVRLIARDDAAENDISQLSLGAST